MPDNCKPIDYYDYGVWKNIQAYGKFDCSFYNDYAMKTGISTNQNSFKDTIA